MYNKMSDERKVLIEIKKNLDEYFCDKCYSVAYEKYVSCEIALGEPEADRICITILINGGTVEIWINNNTNVDGHYPTKTDKYKTVLDIADPEFFKKVILFVKEFTIEYVNFRNNELLNSIKKRQELLSTFK